MLDPQKTREREAVLKRIRELDAEVAQHERNLREFEAQISIEEQLSLKLRRFIEANIQKLTRVAFIYVLCSFLSTILRFCRAKLPCTS